MHPVKTVPSLIVQTQFTEFGVVFVKFTVNGTHPNVISGVKVTTGIGSIVTFT